MSSTSPSDLVRPRDAAEVTGLTPGTYRRWCRENKCPHSVRRGRRPTYYISVSALIPWLLAEGVVHEDELESIQDELLARAAPYGGGR